MTLLRVFLFKGGHPLYETLVNHPPVGVEYLPRRPTQEMQEYALYQPGHSVVRKVVDGAFSLVNLPRYYPVLRKYDLVHSGRGFFILGPNKYVVDVEHVASFAGMRHARLTSPGLRKAIARSLAKDKCFGLLPHCHAARKTISLVTADRRVDSKTTVIYPSVEPVKTSPRKAETVPEILFMGEYFWKGGREVLAACERLASRLDFHLTYISLRVHPPESLIKKIREKVSVDYIQGPIPRSRLFEEIYPKTDVFAMPTYIDTFGYAFLEAMSHGIPCIGARHFAVPEIISHDVTGIIVEPPLSYFDEKGVGHPELAVESYDNARTVEELASAIERLVSSASLRERMGASALREVTDGRFSIAKRNALLRSVYEGVSA